MDRGLITADLHLPEYVSLIFYFKTSFMDTSTSSPATSRETVVPPFSAPLGESTPRVPRVKPVDHALTVKTESVATLPTIAIESPESPVTAAIVPAAATAPAPPVSLPPEMAMDYDSNSSRESETSMMQQQRDSSREEDVIAPTTSLKADGTETKPAKDASELATTEMAAEGKATNSATPDEEMKEEESSVIVPMKSNNEAIAADADRALSLSNGSSCATKRIVDHPAVVMANGSSSIREGTRSPIPIVKSEENTNLSVNDVHEKNMITSGEKTPPPSAPSLAVVGGAAPPPSALDILSNLLSSSASSSPVKSESGGRTEEKVPASVGVVVSAGDSHNSIASSSHGLVPASLPSAPLTSSSVDGVVSTESTVSPTRLPAPSSASTSSAEGSVTPVAQSNGTDGGETTAASPPPATTVVPQSGFDLMAALLAQAAKGIGGLPQITVSSSAASGSGVSSVVPCEGQPRGSSTSSVSSVGRAGSPRDRMVATAAANDGGGRTPETESIPATTPAPLTLSLGGYTLTIPAGAVLSQGLAPSSSNNNNAIFNPNLAGLSNVASTSTSLTSALNLRTTVGASPSLQTSGGDEIPPTPDDPTPTLDESNPFDN